MKIPSLKEVVSAQEWQLRVDLAAAYRLVAAYGWSDLVDAMSGSAELNLIGPGPIAANANVTQVSTAGQGANLAWPALLRKLDRENPGYDS